MKFAILAVSIVFSVSNKTLRLNYLKTRTAMNAKISGFVICDETIIYSLSYNPHECIFKEQIFKNIQT